MVFDSVATGNVMSSAGVAPPTKLPAIVTTSPTSYPDPPEFIDTDVIPPLPFVTTSNVAPDPSNSAEDRTAVYV